LLPGRAFRNPLRILKENDLDNPILYLPDGFTVAAWWPPLLEQFKKYQSSFCVTDKNFGAHILVILCSRHVLFERVPWIIYLF